MILKVNPDKCTGCEACEVFCSLEQERVVNPALSRIRVMKDEPRNVFLPIVCPPCDEKPCIAACPEPGGIVVSPQTGAVIIVDARCTGCLKCANACEIGAIRLVRQSGRGKRGKAVAVKCNQCGGDPWCVRVCEPGALEYVSESPAMTGQMVFERQRVALIEAERMMADRDGRPFRRMKAR